MSHLCVLAVIGLSYLGHLPQLQWLYSLSLMSQVVSYEGQR